MLLLWARLGARTLTATAAGPRSRGVRVNPAVRGPWPHGLLVAPRCSCRSSIRMRASGDDELTAYWTIASSTDVLGWHRTAWASCGANRDTRTSSRQRHWPPPAEQYRAHLLKRGRQRLITHRDERLDTGLRIARPRPPCTPPARSPRSEGADSVDQMTHKRVPVRSAAIDRSWRLGRPSPLHRESDVALCCGASGPRCSDGHASVQAF